LSRDQRLLSADGCVFFPPCQRWRGQQSVWCPDVISVSRCQPSMAAPHTYGGSSIPHMTSAAPRCGDALRPRKDAVPAYRPLHKAGCACRARPCVAGAGGGSTRQPCASTRRRCRRQRGGPINRKGAGRRVLSTPGRAKTQPRRTSGGLAAGASPDAAREAPGAPARLPEDRRQRSIAKAVWRLRMESTARPS
jgi:hypothetical protein